MAIKRARYFDQQFLREADFTDEQKYHLDMRRRLNRALYTFGIAEGLEVAKSVAGKAVTVRPGTAIDRDGREMIVEKAIDLPVQFPAGAAVFITIAYQEQETDPSTAGVSGNTRVTEQAIVRAVMAPPPPTDGTVVRLASFTLDATGNVPGNPNDTFDGGVRQTVGPKGGFGLSLDGVSNPGGNVDLFPGPGIAIVPDQPNRRITIANQGLVSVDGVSNPGGNVDLVAPPGQAIVITPDDANNRITIGESHSTLTNNPHNVTAAQTGALVSVAGVSNPVGNVDLVAPPGQAIVITPDDANNRITIGENHSARTDNPHKTTAEQVGALPITGGSITGPFGASDSNDFSFSVAVGSMRLGKSTTPPGTSPVATDFGFRAQVTARGGFSTTHARETAVVVAQSDVAGINGINTYAPNGTLALFVSGTAQFTGAKTGYVVDTFLNASGQKLRIGDVVKLKGTPITRFQGDANKIPVPEVALADKENDSKVIGIVDREAIPEQDAPDTRVDPEDPTFIEDGGALFVVTLGTYAHCKVDATAAPIEVGDLLTSSSNPGHAKKATDPKIGSIIGKALEPLEEGTGYIALFVNIQ